MKFCLHCGKEITNETIICPDCGCYAQSTALVRSVKQSETAANKPRGSFLERASLLISGLIMALLTWPMVAWYTVKLRLSGGVYSVLKAYNDYDEMKIWRKADAAFETLEIFMWISGLLLILGLIFFIIETKKIIPKSRIRSVCFFVIPVIITVAVVIRTYPAIFDYESTFYDLIYDLYSY